MNKLVTNHCRRTFFPRSHIYGCSIRGLVGRISSISNMQNFKLYFDYLKLVNLLIDS